MKLFFACILICLSLCFSVNAQAKKPALPGNLTKYVNEYPDKLMKVTAVKTRLKTLLGKKYSIFDLSIAVQEPMTQVGDFILASGCMAHACTINEAAFAIDLTNKRIHAVIYEINKPAKYFNEDNAATPQVLLNWVKDHQNK
ncbi:MAG: hypothetical protein K1X72_09500 [Pyrinomonadaceae bacterium]|nr:hypothetical protein [Pyrinomonadaceae bacterium]